MSAVQMWWLDCAASRDALAGIEAKHRLLVAAREDDLTGERRIVRTALRIALWHAAGEDAARCRFEIERRGRPRLPRGHDPVAFSISHTTGFAALALHMQEPLGVDIERERPLQMSPSAREAMAIAARNAGLIVPEPTAVSQNDRAFLKLWVQLEALGKARGDGIGAVLEAIGFRHSGAHAATSADERPSIAPAQCSITPLALPGAFVGALAHHSEASPGELRTFPSGQSAIESLCASEPDQEC